MIPFVKYAAFTLLSVATALGVLTLSSHRYEWMVGERNDDGTVLTLCTLPADPDSTRLMMAVFTAAPLLLAFVIAWRLPAARPLAILVATALLAVWLYRFFLRFHGCAP